MKKYISLSIPKRQNIFSKFEELDEKRKLIKKHKFSSGEKNTIEREMIQMDHYFQLIKK